MPKPTKKSTKKSTKKPSLQPDDAADLVDQMSRLTTRSFTKLNMFPTCQQCWGKRPLMPMASNT
jgi:hypothetical protein